MLWTVLSLLFLGSSIGNTFMTVDPVNGADTRSCGGQDPVTENGVIHDPSCLTIAGAFNSSFFIPYVTLQLAAGTHTIGPDTLNINFEMSFLGTGPDSTIINVAGSGSNVIVIYGQLTLSALSVTSSSPNTNFSSFHVHNGNFLAQNILFKNNIARPVYGHMDSTVQIVNATFIGNSAVCVTITDTTQIQISQSSFVSNVLSDPSFLAAGLMFTSVASLSVQNSSFSANSRAVAVAINPNFSGYEGNISFVSTIFDSNFAAVGGAVTFVSVTNQLSASFDSCLFSNNVANGGGGGAISFVENPSTFFTSPSSLSLSSSSFIGNSASGSGGSVAAIFSNPASSLSVSSSSFRNNLASASAGGIFIDGGAVEIADSNFNANTAATIGGGIYGHQIYLEIESCLFVANSAQAGGGIAIASAGSNANSFDSLTFNSNFANTTGGGLYIFGASAEISDGIFVNNSARTGGGIFIGGDVPTPNALLSIEDTQFKSNIALPASGPPPNGCGGGVYFSAFSSVEISTVIFQGNSAAHGGGLYVAQGPPNRPKRSYDYIDADLATAIFSSNFASIDGGGMSVEGSMSVRLASSYLTNNSAPMAQEISVGASSMLTLTSGSSLVLSPSGSDISLASDANLIFEDGSKSCGGGGPNISVTCQNSNLLSLDIAAWPAPISSNCTVFPASFASNQFTTILRSNVTLPLDTQLVSQYACSCGVEPVFFVLDTSLIRTAKGVSIGIADIYDPSGSNSSSLPLFSANFYLSGKTVRIMTPDDFPSGSAQGTIETLGALPESAIDPTGWGSVVLQVIPLSNSPVCASVIFQAFAAPPPDASHSLSRTQIILIAVLVPAAVLIFAASALLVLRMRSSRRGRGIDQITKSSDAEFGL